MLPSNRLAACGATAAGSFESSENKDDHSETSSSSSHRVPCSGPHNSLSDSVLNSNNDNLVRLFATWCPDGTSALMNGNGITTPSVEDRKSILHREMELPNSGDSQETSDPPGTFIDNRIYVSNIPFSYTSVDLEKIFSRFGTVLASQVVTNERGSKGFGFVTLNSPKGCARAREELDGTMMGGRRIEVKKARQMQHANPTNGRLAAHNVQTLRNNPLHTRSLLSPLLSPLTFDGKSNLNTLGGLNGDVLNAALLGVLPNVGINPGITALAQYQQQWMQAGALMQQMVTAQHGLYGAPNLMQSAALMQLLTTPSASMAIPPYGVDGSQLLRQSGLGASSDGMVLGGAEVGGAVDPMAMATLAAALSGSRGGMPTSMQPTMAPLLSMPAPPSLSFDPSLSSRKRPQLAWAPPISAVPLKHARRS